MEEKVSFFTKLKNAIINFEAYQNFATEKTGKALRYLIKIILIFALLVSIVLVYKAYNLSNKIIDSAKINLPQFKFVNNALETEENSAFEFIDEKSSFAILIEPEKTKVDNIEYQKQIVFLKDKIAINYMNSTQNIMYEQIAQNYDINNLTKQVILDYFNTNNLTKVYIILFSITLLYTFGIYFVLSIFDVFMLSILGILISKVCRINLKYKAIFNISIYAMTLPIVLYIIYTLINLFTEFSIEYFQLAYNAISYIYIITAILIIKSNLIKQQVEVMKIVEEQKKIKQEQEEQEKKQEEKNKKSKDKEEKKKQKKKEKEEQSPNQAPEGNKA